ncbi:hypothetical protein ACFL0V_02035, partial [Nanoarchaeota archaeon]
FLTIGAGYTAVAGTAAVAIALGTDRPQPRPKRRLELVPPLTRSHREREAQARDPTNALPLSYFQSDSQQALVYCVNRAEYKKVVKSFEELGVKVHSAGDISFATADINNRTYSLSISHGDHWLRSQKYNLISLRGPDRKMKDMWKAVKGSKADYTTVHLGGAVADRYIEEIRASDVAVVSNNARTSRDDNTAIFLGLIGSIAKRQRWNQVRYDLCHIHDPLGRIAARQKLSVPPDNLSCQGQYNWRRYIGSGT